MAENVAVPLPAQVEVGMLREVAERGFVRRGGEVQLQFVVVSKGINRRHLEIAGETFLSVLADVGQFQCRPVGAEP